MPVGEARVQLDRPRHSPELQCAAHCVVIHGYRHHFGACEACIGMMRGVEELGGAQQFGRILPRHRYRADMDHDGHRGALRMIGVDHELAVELRELAAGAEQPEMADGEFDAS